MSSYQVIARKWRPQVFADVIGQEHIARTLQNAIQQDRVGHAYLFVGSRGIGKTTTARIFAKALNCESRQGTEPCCVCRNCQEITKGNSLDVVEIDGASHNKVEDVRDIRDTVQYTPNRSRYRIYIIDEVHMLSTAAWNALLKTLEEPPAHVKFLFATTEPHKVLPTILSRCQRLDLKRIPVGLIAKRLRFIADNHKDAAEKALPIKVDERALVAIARAADGGMRDAQSIFDQMISFCGGLESNEPIREQDVMEVFGLASGCELRDLTRALLTNDLAAIVDLLQQFADRGRDLEHLHGDLVEYLRNLLVFQLCRNASQLLAASAAELEDLTLLAGLGPAGVTQRLFEGMMGQEGFLRYALNKRLALEVAFVRVMQDAHSVSVSDVITRLVQWQQHGPSIAAPPPAAPPSPPAVGAPPTPTAKKMDAATSAPAAPKPAAPPVVPAANVITPVATAPGQPASLSPLPAPAKAEVAAAPPATPVLPPSGPIPAAAVATAPTPSPAPQTIASGTAAADDATRAAASASQTTPPAATAPAALTAPVVPPTTAAGNDEDSAQLATRWQQAADLIRKRAEGSHLVAVMERLRPLLFRNGVLTLAYDEGVSAEELKLIETPLQAETLQDAFRQTFGAAQGRVVLKRWVERVSSSEKRPRLVSSQEVRQRVENNPFVKRVCDLFQAKIVDVRG